MMFFAAIGMIGVGAFAALGLFVALDALFKR